MITNIWLKSQPNKKISYPDCFPVINYRILSFIVLGCYIKNSETQGQDASYSIELIQRIEFRP